MKHTQIFYSLGVGLLLMLQLIACGGSKTEKDNETTDAPVNMQNTPTTESTPTTTEQNLAQRITIKNKQGLNIVSFEITQNETIIMYENGSTLVGERTKADKTKYIDANGDVFAEVKYKEDGFKVRTPDGELLWKVKIKEDKVKISDNEENLNPNEVKKKDTGYKSYMAGREKEIGKIKFKDGMVDIDGEATDLKVPAEKNSYAFGVLLFTNIPKEQRYIIMAELLAKGL